MSSATYRSTSCLALLEDRARSRPPTRPPPRARRPIWASIPTPIDAVRESMTWISRSGSMPARDPCRLERAGQGVRDGRRTRRRPRRRRRRPANTARKSPGAAAAVVGNGASGAVMRAQNSSVVMVTLGRKLSEPKLTTSGTTMMPVPRRDVGRHVAGGVGDDRDAGHGRGSSIGARPPAACGRSSGAGRRLAPRGAAPAHGADRYGPANPIASRRRASRPRYAASRRGSAAVLAVHLRHLHAASRDGRDRGHAHLLLRRVPAATAASRSQAVGGRRPRRAVLRERADRVADLRRAVGPGRPPADHARRARRSARSRSSSRRSRSACRSSASRGSSRAARPPRRSRRSSGSSPSPPRPTSSRAAGPSPASRPRPSPG